MSQLKVQVVERDTTYTSLHMASAGVVSYLMYDVKKSELNVGMPEFASVRHRHSGIKVSPKPLVTIYSYPLPSYDYTQYAYGTVGL